MEGSPGNLSGTPEEGERLNINTIIIPADDEIAMRQDQIGTSHLPDYQAITGGLIERVGMDNPASSLYFNEEGKLLELPVNRRATLLLWMHNPAFRYQDVIVGDALVVGPGDGEGYDTNVPDDLAKVLFEAHRFRAEVQVHGEEDWHGNDLHFDNWVDAYAYVLDLGRRWTLVREMRVVPEE